MKRALTTAVMAWTMGVCGCGGRWEELPAQAAEVRGEDPVKRPCYVATREPRAAEMWRGVLLSGGADSWTEERAEVRCQLPEDGAWEAVVDFRVEAGPLRRTGPVTVEFRVNGVEAGRMRCAAAGGYQWRKAVGRWAVGREMTLAMKIGPVVVSEGDGQKLGVLLTGGGFERR